MQGFRGFETVDCNVPSLANCYQFFEETHTLEMEATGSYKKLVGLTISWTLLHSQ
jgi:hypothetical protein